MPVVRLLHLLRHAKSSWADPELADRDRPLAPRGRRAAGRVAGRLAGPDVAPEVVLCSPALRARQTLEPLLPALGEDVETLFEEGLYGAGAGDLLRRLRLLPDHVRRALVVGHNPALQDLALDLAASGADLDRLRLKLPTAALVTLAVPVPWARLRPGSCALVGYVVPDRER